MKTVIDDSQGVVSSANGSGLDVKGSMVCLNTAGLRDARTFRDSGNQLGAQRTAATATTLAVNTQYSAGGGALAMLIPSAAAGKAGDWITVLYTAVQTAGTAHSFTTTTDTAYALGSTILRADGAVANQIDISAALDNILTITAEANGDGGIGTLIRFVNTSGALNGWAVEATIRGQGVKSVAKNAATVFS